MTTISKAAETSMDIGIVNSYESGYSYEINGRKIAKLIKYSSDQGSHTWDDTIYGLTAEKGFTSKEVGLNRALYNKALDLKKDTIPEGYWKIGENKSAVLWILDNSLVAKQGSEEEKVALLRQAQITRDLLSAEEMEIVTQAAIWYFTNPEDPTYHTEEFGKLLTIPTEGNYQKVTEQELEEKWMQDKQRQEDASKLYHYLITSAKQASSQFDEDKHEFIAPITIQKKNPTVQIREDGTTIVGPYTITKHTNAPIRIEQLFQDQAGKQITDYHIVSANGTEFEQSVEEMVRQADPGQDISFWVNVESGNNKIMEITCKIHASYPTSHMTFWTNGISFAKQQPIVMLERQENQIEETITIPVEKVDYALKSYISAVNGQEITRRAPEVRYDEEIGKLIYTGVKEPLAVKSGDLITFNFRVYNEGTVDGYVNSMIANIPEGFSFLLDNDTNLEYNWEVSEDLTMLTTNYLAKPDAFLEDQNRIKAYDKNQMEIPEYKEVKLVLKVVEKNASNRILIQYAEINGLTDAEGNKVEDVDSVFHNHNLLEDDMDFEKVKIQEFDLGLQTFISQVNQSEITNRVPTAKVNPETMQITYQKPKQDPVRVQKGDLVTYTIRIYNEGDIEGYAKTIRQQLPEGMQLAQNHGINHVYGWKQTEEGMITTSYLAKESEEVVGANKLKAFDGTIQKLPDYRDVKVVLEVTKDSNDPNPVQAVAEIMEDTDGLGNDLTDRDSIPGNGQEGEDDIDFDQIKVEYGDLYLTQFITQIGTMPVNNREIQVSYTEENQTWQYRRNSNKPVVKKEDVVIYTIRLYNQGTVAGYASSIVDYIPQDLEFIQDHPINMKYEWQMISDQQVVTNYLAKEKGANPIQVPNAKTKQLDYAEVQIALQVKKDSKQDIITNKAEIQQAKLDNGDILRNRNIEQIGETLTQESVVLEQKAWKVVKKITDLTIEQEGQEGTHVVLLEDQINQEVKLESSMLTNAAAQITYQITITNEGNIASMLPTILEQIPEDMILEENADWKLEEGKLIRKKQENRIMLPGQSEVITLKVQTNQAKKVTNLANTKTKLISATTEGDKTFEQENSIQIKEKVDPIKWIVISVLAGSIGVIGTIAIKKIVKSAKKKRQK